MNGKEFREARKSLGLSLSATARILRLGKSDDQDRWRKAARTIRRWEADENDIPGPAQVLMEWLAHGKKPDID